MNITQSPEGREHRPFDGPYFILEPWSGADLMVLHEDRQWIALFEHWSFDACEHFIRQRLDLGE